MAKRIDPATAPVRAGSSYPPPHHRPCVAREHRLLSDAAGLTQFGVNLLRLPPGTWSSQRHWHTHEDEFVYVVAGEVVLVTEDGEETLRPGDSAGFKAGDDDGHCLQNRGNADALILQVGTRVDEDVAYYSDIDMMVSPDGPAPFKRRDGTPYPDQRRRGPEDA